MTTPAKVSSARQFFSRHGALSKWHPNYEHRPGQAEMAEAVESAIADRKHLIVEAGTGTGKTLAYLVPALSSGKRIVVSTGTKNLQEQLFFKDIPFLQKHFPRPLQVCYMKGRSNYACRQKIYDAENEAVLDGFEEVADFQIIHQWEKTTEFGDRAEIKTLPESSSAWIKIDARRELCSGQKCSKFPKADGRTGFEGRAAFLDVHLMPYTELLTALELTRSHLKLLQNQPDEVNPLIRRTDELMSSLKFVLESEDSDFVYWIERRGRGCFLQATPVDVSAILTERLFDKLDTVILTSATLAVAGSFEFAKTRLGLPYARTLVVPGHFDYQKQALLYVPQQLPDPRDPAFTRLAAEEITKLLEASR